MIRTSRPRLGQSFILFAAVVALIATSAPKAFAQSIDDPSEGAVELPSDAPSAYPPKNTSAPAPHTGRKAAEKYMAPRSGRDQSNVRNENKDFSSGFGNKDAHYLAVSIGSFVSDNAYKWGARDSAGNVGSWMLGVTYRVGEWTNSFDLNVRVDLQRFKLDEGSATKIAFLPMITFPDASSKFPLFFGVGAGLGVFAQQISNESSLSFDYQLVAGARFFDVYKNLGLFVEAGLKNHVLLLTDGQFNGTFVSVGSVFAF